MQSDRKTRKAFIRRWVPQGLRDIYNLATGRAIRFKGTYSNWEDADRAAAGYAEDSLFQRIERAALSVKDGEAAWEQDGVTHDHIPPDWPTLACLSQATLANNGLLTVLDFGGALGSSYFQARPYLIGVNHLRWHVVEQPHVAASGRKNFETEQLRFHDSLEECLQESVPNIALLSAVLPYLEKPYELLDRIMATPIEFLIIDRHFESMTRELLTVQVVPPSIYPASYPAWLFDRAKLNSTLSRYFEKQWEWAGKDPPLHGRGIGARFSGQLWRRRPAP